MSRPKKKDVSEKVLISTRIPIYLDKALGRLCVEDYSLNKQVLIERAIKEYLEKHYKDIYNEYYSK